MKLVFTIVSLALAVQSQTLIDIAKTPCRPTDPIVNGSYAVKRAGGCATSAPDRQCSAVFQMIDGCRFSVTDFILKPPGLKTYWAGIPKGQPNGVVIRRIVPAPLGSFDGHPAQFTLDGVSWADMDGIGVYSENDNAWYMKAFWVPDKAMSDDSGSDSKAVVATAVTSLAVLAVCVASL